MSTVSIGIVGLGRLGRRHALNLSRSAACNLAAACSPLAEERQWAALNLPAARYYSDYAELLQDPKLDAVFLVTPTALHAAQIILALQAGKHVFCEKPLALNLADCLAVEQEAARHPQLKVMTGFVRRFDPAYREAHQQLTEGRLGQPYLVRSQTCDKYDESGFFVRFAPDSGGIFMDCSIHDIDLARWFLGSPAPKRVWAMGANALHPELAQYGDVDNGLAMCEFADGRMASFYASRTQAHGHQTSTEIYAAAGRLSIGSDPRASQLDISDASGIRHRCLQDFHERFAAAFSAEAQAFIDIIRYDQPSPVSLADAREATRIGLAISQAFHSGTAVSLLPAL